MARKSAQLSGTPHLWPPGASEMRGLGQAKAPGMQKEAGEEPKRQSTRLGLRIERETAGRGKGRPWKAKRGSYRPAGEGGGRERTGRREGAREQSSGRAGPQKPRRWRRGPGPARPGPGSQLRRTKQREADSPKRSCPRPGRARGPRAGDVDPPARIRALTSSQLGRSGYPVPSVQIVRPGSRRLTDPDPNPRRGRPAPPESHCACVTRARAPPPVHAPPTLVTGQRGKQ